jgi:predicted N-formylglutamate amidohydrolase
VSSTTRRLLSASDAPAFRLERPEGGSVFVLACDHAGNLLPSALGDLGVGPRELLRHIAWDIGIAAVAEKLSERLDACLVRQNYSRLAIDANRPLLSSESIVTLSEHTRVPGNEDLSREQIERRQREIFAPYHDCLREQLDARIRAGRPSALCCLHSFTPSYAGIARPWHAGVLSNRDRRLALPILELLREDVGLTIGDNQPYSVSEDSDYTMIVHGEHRGVPCVELEIRQDLIADEVGQNAWAERLARILPLSYARAIGRA